MASDTRVVTKKRGKGGKFISSGEFGKRKFFGEHVNNVRSQAKQGEHETLGENSSESTWSEGRRVVELGILAEGLRACSDCKKPLRLTDIFSEKRYGLASLLTIRCSCGQINSISTGKSHRTADSRRGVPIDDVNTKLATGISYIFLCFSALPESRMSAIFQEINSNLNQ